MSTHQQIVLSIAIACGNFLLLMTALCMLIQPALFDHPHWMSYFGGHRAALLPYYLGLAIVVTCLSRITRLLWSVQGRWRPLRMVF